MARIKFYKKTDQEIFLTQVGKISGLNRLELAKKLGVSTRTLSDWRRNKFNFSEKSFNQCLNLAKGIFIPKYKVLSDFWNVKEAGRKGGLVMFKKYGGPGTTKGRIKGGKVSQKRRRQKPEKYKLLGCKVKKDFRLGIYSEKIAELVGIIIGDGSITNTQLRIYLSKIVDREYAKFVFNLIKETVKTIPSWTEYKNSICLTVSGVGMVEELERIGLKRGNKTIHQISFPNWIKRKKDYRIACVRGLFDTDGGLYFHRHTTKGRRYRNLGFCFTNYSKPIIDEFAKTLSLFNLNFKRVEGKRIYIYDINEVIRFIDVIGSNNRKNLQKLSFHLNSPKRLKN